MSSAAAAVGAGTLTGATGRAIVKNVVSGDTVVLRGRPVGGPPPERLISFANIVAPRQGSVKEPEKEEPYAFEAREFLRKLLVGREVAFKVEYTTTTNKRDFGVISLPPPGVDGETNVTRLLVKEGLAKVKQPDGKRTATEEQNSLSELEAAAVVAKLGVWNDSGAGTRNVSADVPADFFEKNKNVPIDAVIEQVRDGSTFRVLLLLPERHQTITFQLSGVRAPAYRKDVPGTPDLVEPHGEEARYFVESRLLQRDVKVILEGVSNNAFVGTVIHPAGNIAEALAAEGLAKVVDWTLTMVTGGSAKLRAAEQKAKDKKLRIWKDYVAKQRSSDHSFDATVTRIVAADAVLVLPIGKTQERKITIASLRTPKPKDDKESGYNFEAREFLRSKLIGKKVNVAIDFVKPASDGFDERECATIKVGDVNIGEALVSRGLATVVRYKKDDDNRASGYDQLLLAEDKAQKSAKGVHSGKENAAPKLVDASENINRARQYFPTLNRLGNVAGVVEFASSGSRFKIWLPTQSCKITLVLGGIRTARAPRAGEKPEPFGQEALDYVNRKVLQRDVEVHIEAQDKVGGFIGSLFLAGSRDNVAVLLLKQGLAEIHEYSAAQSNYARELNAALEEAQKAKKGVWSTKDPKPAEAVIEDIEAPSGPAETKDVVVSEILGGGALYIQYENEESKKLVRLMDDFAAFHKKSDAPAHTPKNGEFISAKFTLDDQWYRARVKKVNVDKTYQVLYIDYGNSETIPAARIRVLDPKFSTMTLPAQAREAVLAYLTVPQMDEDYGDDAYDRLRDLLEGKKLQARIVGRSTSAVTNGQVLNVVLYDPAVSQTKSVNETLVHEGLATISKVYAKRWAATGAPALNGKGKGNENVQDAFQEAQKEAKKNRTGMWRYGDVTEDD